MIAQKLFSEGADSIGTENAFAVGAHIGIVEKKTGVKVVRMNLGEPDFNIPYFTKFEIQKQIEQNNTHYTSPQGTPQFREAIASYMTQNRRHKDNPYFTIKPEQVVVFPGGKPSIGLAQQIYCNPGDEVIYPSPGFPMYESFTKYLGLVSKPLHLDESKNFTFTGKDLEDLITPKTKLIYLCFPSNPTGGVATLDQLKEYAEVIQRKCGPNVRVYSDEIYEDIVFDGKKHYSIATIPGMEKITIINSGFSKGFAFTGGRMGYACFPTAEEAQKFVTFNINYFSCIPPFMQEAGRVSLMHPDCKKVQGAMVSEFQKRRDDIVVRLNNIEGVKCQNPGGAFYLFPNIQGALEKLGAIELYEKLLAKDSSIQKFSSPSTLFQMFCLYKYQVAVLDRRAFGTVGHEGRHYIRLSIAADLPSLQEGVRRIEAATKDKEGFAKFVEEGGPLHLKQMKQSKL